MAALALAAGWFSQNRSLEPAGGEESISAVSSAAGVGGAGGKSSGHSKLSGPKGSALHVQKRQELIEAIHRLPIYAGITLRTRSQCAAIARSLYRSDKHVHTGQGVR